MFALPIVLAVVNICLLIFVFPFDTPTMLKQKGQFEKLNTFMSKIYAPSAVEGVIQEIGGAQAEGEPELSMKAVFTHPHYRRASILGCFLSMAQQLTGINVIMFYSNSIFSSSEGGDISLSANASTALVGTVNFVCTLGGLALLSRFGRRTLMLFGSIAMAATLVAVGIAALKGLQVLEIIFVLMFVAFFEFSSGPITWLYMAEIMQAKALGVAVCINWLVNLVISAAIPPLIKAIGEDNIGYIFIFCGALTITCFFFIYWFMEETRGKTALEIEEMFIKDNKFKESAIAK